MILPYQCGTTRITIQDVCYSSGKEIYGLFIPAQNKAHLFAVDSVRTNNMPNMRTLYEQEHGLT